MSIHQQAMITAEPSQVYAVLADASALSALSGRTGEPAFGEGEEFSAFDGNVTGRQIELVPGRRIVQAWRFPHWEPGVYSVVRFELAEADGGALLTIDQHGEPGDWHEHVDTNWPTFYLTPIAEHFSVTTAG